MSPKLFSLNFLIKKRKPQPQETIIDELALVKAAAWAWYQHGSATEGKTKSEFDFTRTKHVARPSRYKLEAMRLANEAKEGTNKSLLDNYEVQRISRQLDRLIESSNNKVINGNNFTNYSGKEYNGNRRMNKKKIIKGFWPRNGVVCGGGNDVVDVNALKDKRVALVSLAKFNSVL